MTALLHLTDYLHLSVNFAGTSFGKIANFWLYSSSATEKQHIRSLYLSHQDVLEFIFEEDLSQNVLQLGKMHLKWTINQNWQHFNCAWFSTAYYPEQKATWDLPMSYCMDVLFLCFFAFSHISIPSESYCSMQDAIEFYICYYYPQSLALEKVKLVLVVTSLYCSVGKRVLALW